MMSVILSIVHSVDGSFLLSFVLLFSRSMFSSARCFVCRSIMLSIVLSFSLSFSLLFIAVV